MQLAVITPTHNAQWLEETANSLQAQTFQGSWEWIIVANGPYRGEVAAQAEKIAEGLPCKVMMASRRIDTIGALKRHACGLTDAEVVVELDHDDLLSPEALAEVWQAFEAHPEVGSLYSNYAEFHDGTWEPHVYDVQFAQYVQDVEFYGHTFKEQSSYPPSAHLYMSIGYAPNHVRAWRSKVYWELEGHDTSLPICDDFDLMCRLYIVAPVLRLDKCLYLYRRHLANTWANPQKHQQLEQLNAALRNRYFHDLVNTWAVRENGIRVDACSGAFSPPGYMGVDLIHGPVRADLRKPWPFPDSSVHVVRAYDALEHLPDQWSTMSEIHRVLVPGGWLLTQTPSTDGRGAWQDPTHCSFWNENSFWYYTRKEQADYIGNETIRFQEVRKETVFLNDFNKQHGISHVIGDFVALKPGYIGPGLVEI
jgi:glycosyltransferase involved in cell wall biosynthesis